LHFHCYFTFELPSVDSLGILVGFFSVSIFFVNGYELGRVSSLFFSCCFLICECHIVLH
jgi:hypothetical protein